MTNTIGNMTNKDIYELRQSLNLSMNDFGRMFGVTIPAVHKWENGENSPSSIIQVSMQTLKTKMEQARLRGREQETRDELVRLIVFGGLAAILIYLFTKD